MTEQDPGATPLVDADLTPADRFKELPEGVDADEAEARIKRAFSKHGRRRQERRDLEVAKFQAAERREAIRLNRGNALRTVTEDGVKHFFGACACRWHGLRVSDPEIALREYDAHACTIPLDMEADHPAFRDLRMGGDGKLVKRGPSDLALNQVQADGAIVNTLTQPVGAEVAPVKPATLDDAAEIRAALLELK